MIQSNHADNAVLNLFIEKIEFLASNQVSEDFFNSGSNHALIVLKTIAKYAKNSIKILAGNLCTSISSDPEYLNHLKNFFLGGGKIQVLLCDFENGNDHFNKGIYKLFVEYKNSVELKKTNARFEIQEGNPIHFTVADNRMYRLETDVNGKVARGNFNDTKNSTILENAFDSVFNSEKSAAIVFPE